MAHSISLPSISSNTAGSLEQYIQAVNRIPLLSADEERNLASRLQDDGDVDAAHQLVTSHLRMVVSIARGYLGYGLPHADLIQEGNIGLMKAVKRFDPKHGVRLVSFALHWVKAEINEYVIRNWRLVKVATTKAQRKLFFNLRSLKHNNSGLSEADANIIAEQLGVKTHEVLEMDMRLNGNDIALDNEQDDSDNHFAPITWLEDHSAEPLALLESHEQSHLQQTGLSNALASLDERSRNIIQRRWLKEDGGPTLQELAQEYGVSAERVRQIEARAMQKLRLHLTPQDH